MSARVTLSGFKELDAQLAELPARIGLAVEFDLDHVELPRHGPIFPGPPLAGADAIAGHGGDLAAADLYMNVARLVA